MEKLYPIIRRVRRPLLPPDDPKTVEEIPPSPQPSPPGEGEPSAAIGASKPAGSSSGSENETNKGGDVEKSVEGSQGVAVDLPLLGGEGRGEGERSSNPSLLINKGKSRRKEKVPDAPQTPAT